MLDLKKSRQILCNVLKVALGLVEFQIGLTISDIIYYVMKKFNISQQGMSKRTA